MPERLEERILRGVYPNNMVSTMQHVAKNLRGSFKILVQEGEDYNMPTSIKPLQVREGHTYIQIRLKRISDFDPFWKTVNELHKPKQDLTDKQN